MKFWNFKNSADGESADLLLYDQFQTPHGGEMKSHRRNLPVIWLR